MFGFLQPTRLLLQYFTDALSHLLNTTLHYNEINLADHVGIEPTSFFINSEAPNTLSAYGQ